MKRFISFLILFTLCFWCVFAQEPYLKTQELPDLIKCLPAPPEKGSQAFKNDVYRYKWGKEQRKNAELAELAKRDAVWTYEALVAEFTPSFGLAISKTATPQIWTLLATSLITIDQIRVAPKAYFHRIRPFEYFKESTFTGEDDVLRGEGSYPSGHTIRSWLTALILSELNPAAADAIYARAWVYGDSRVIAGAHWQSDVDASRVAASIGYSRLQSCAAFRSQMALAQDEFYRLTGVKQGQPLPGNIPVIASELKYNKEGKIKILQLTDTHVVAGDPRSERTIQNLNAVLDAEKPDFVIHTGDIVYGKPAGESATLALKALVDRGIPFAVALGNHDSDFDLSREEMLKHVRSISGNVNTGANDIITLSGRNGLERVFYLFDSGNRDWLAGVKSWGYVHHEQIDWYRSASNYFKSINGGTPVPSLAFFHIPVPEYRQAMHDASKKARFLCGNIGEEPASPKFNSGLYVAMREQGDVQGIITGHDHNNDFVLLWQGFFFIYGRYSGCDTVYNDLKPNGARVFEFTEGQPGFRTWIRLCDGRIEQDMQLYPGMKTFSDIPE